MRAAWVARTRGSWCPACGITAWHVEGHYLVWSVEVETPLGLAAGHATANLGDGAKGVDARNPFENGETSALRPRA